MTDSELAMEREQLLGAELDLGLGADEVCAPMIRAWSEAFHDENTHYLEGGTAPPPQVASFARRPYWPRVEGQSHRGLIGIASDVLNCNESIVQRFSFDFHSDLMIGDRVRCVEKIASISEPKTTHLGTGYFVGLEREYFNQEGELLSVAHMPFFKYARGSERSEKSTRRAVTPEVSESLTELPSLDIELSVTQMVMMAYVSRDFNPVHHDMEYAQANGADHMFIQWACYGGILFSYLHKALGNSAKILKLGVEMKSSTYPGPLELRGFETARTTGQDGDEVGVKVALRRGNTTMVTATAQVLLP